MPCKLRNMCFFSPWGEKKRKLKLHRNISFHLESPMSGDFPGGRVAKTLCSQCWGLRFDPWSGNWIPQATTKNPTCHSKDRRSCMLQPRPGAAKRKKESHVWWHTIGENRGQFPPCMAGKRSCFNTCRDKFSRYHRILKIQYFPPEAGSLFPDALSLPFCAPNLSPPLCSECIPTAPAPGLILAWHNPRPSFQIQLKTSLWDGVECFSGLCIPTALSCYLN